VPKLKEIYAALKDKGLVIVGVHTVEEAESVPAFVKEQKIDWPIVIDKDDKTGKAFGVEGWPTTVLIDKSGKIVEISDHATKETIEKLLKEDVKEEPKPEKKADEKK
jgi:peroxiredoxin